MSTSTSVPPPALLVDLRTAAKMLSISTRTVWQLAADGALPCMRIGRRLLFPIAALERYVEEWTVASPQTDHRIGIGGQGSDK